MAECNSQPVFAPTTAEIQASEEKVADMSRLVEILGLNQKTENEISANSSRLQSKQITTSEKNEAMQITKKYNKSISPNSVLSQPSISDSLSPASIPTSNFLSMPTVAQANGYYCGPASAYLVLGHQGCNVRQSGLAGNNYLQTDKYQSTPFGNNWTTTMNAYSDHTYNLLWGSSSDTTARAIELTDTAIGTIATGDGVIYDTIQYPSSAARLVGYPSSISATIYHYVAGEGYDASNSSSRVCYYNDPNGARPAAFGHQTIGFRLMCTIIKDRGLIS